MPTNGAEASASAPTLRQALLDVPHVSPQAWQSLGWLPRWLIASRAAVLSLTLGAALFGGVLALPWTPGEAALLLLVTVALMFAHATSNLLNDAVDWYTGLDRAGYFRLHYGAHPLAQGLLAPRAFVTMLLGTGAIALLLALAVCWRAGAPAHYLAAAGAMLMLAYSWPLKRLGLGELTVFAVWGPLMAGGTHRVISGAWSDDVAVLTAIFGLGATVVVFAKHTDKRQADAARGVRTLPVILGERWAPVFLAALAGGQVVAGLCWALLAREFAYLLLLAAVPSLLALLATCRRLRPMVRPARYPANLWPLWYTVAGFRFVRASSLALLGAALMQGLW